MANINAGSGDRLGFGLFLSLALHAVVFLWFKFQHDLPSSNASDLDVTIVTHFSDRAPEEADYLAQANQQASGTLADAAVPTAPEVGDRAMDAKANTQQQQPQQQLFADSIAVVTTTAFSDEKLSPEQGDEADQTERSEEAARREAMLARLDSLRQEYAKRPRIGTLTSVAAKARADAAYQVHLQERVIAVGNQNYPAESIQNSVFGSLRLMLTIGADGTLLGTEIAESSGHTLLDSAAVRIARLSAPYDPFPAELAAKYDQIVFIRTWQFLPGGSLVTSE